MEDVNVVCLFDARNAYQAPPQDPEHALRELDRKTLRQHSRHAFASLARMAVFSATSYFAWGMLGHPLGAMLFVISSYMILNSLAYSFKGHRKISRYRKAKRYWLLDEAGRNHDLAAAELELLEDSGLPAVTSAADASAS